MANNRVLVVNDLRKAFRLKDGDEPGITKYRLHILAGVSWDRVNRLCTEKTMPPETKYMTLRGIADALRCGIDDLEATVDE